MLHKANVMPIKNKLGEIQEKKILSDSAQFDLHFFILQNFLITLSTPPLAAASVLCKFKDYWLLSLIKSRTVCFS